MKHKLSDIVMLTLFAVLSNANEWCEIEAFGIKKEKENYVVTKEKEHSAIVTREYFLTTNIKWLSVKKDWKGLKSIGVEKKIIEKKNGQIINEDRYFICIIESNLC